MAYKVDMRDDRILKITFNGLVNGDDMAAYMQAFHTYRTRATDEHPLQFLVVGTDVEKVSSSARKALIDMFREPDPLAGETAIVGGSRYVRVLVGFVMKATGKKDMRLFGTEDEALAWLQGARG